MPITFFKDWFWSKLPLHFHKDDTYLDLNDEGVLQRYLRNFGMELDEGIKPFIDNFMDLFDAMKCRVDLLPQLSFILGLPVNLDNTEATYRRVLAYAVAIYRIKGTAKSYKAIFNLLGLSIQIIEDDPKGNDTYDADANFQTYDASTLPVEPAPDEIFYDSQNFCSTYTIAYNNAGNTPVDPALLELAKAAICSIQPINARLGQIIPRLAITEGYGLAALETTNLPEVDIPEGAYSDAFDNDNSYS